MVKSAQLSLKDEPAYRWKEGSKIGGAVNNEIGFEAHIDDLYNPTKVSIDQLKLSGKIVQSGDFNIIETCNKLLKFLNSKFL